MRQSMSHFSHLNQPCASTVEGKKHSVRRSRALLEDYWTSVQKSNRERPLYHTFSDRYGGTNGIRYASRMFKAETTQVNKCNYNLTINDVDVMLEQIDCAIANKEVESAKEMLTQLLTFLQNWNGGLTLNELTLSVRHSATSSEYATQVLKTLLYWSKLHLINNNYAEALHVLNLALEINPLFSDIYALRAACYEYMLCPQEAYEEYEKYLKLSNPSLLMESHCGKCAAESHNFTAAKSYLERVIATTENSLENEGNNELHDLSAVVNKEERARIIDSYRNGEEKDSTMKSESINEMSFFNALAHFFLGYAYAHEAATCADELNTLTCNTKLHNKGTNDNLHDEQRYILLSHSAQHYRLASENAEFIKVYEKTVDDAFARNDYASALQILHYLQLILPECAKYYLYEFKIYKCTHDVCEQLRVLSSAIDCTEELKMRSVIILARGVLYMEYLLDYNKAIEDFTLIIESTLKYAPFQKDSLARCYVRIAYYKRARCYTKRQQQEQEEQHSRLLCKADEDAILEDYRLFLLLCDDKQEVTTLFKAVTEFEREINTSIWNKNIDKKFSKCSVNDTSDISEKNKLSVLPRWLSNEESAEDNYSTFAQTENDYDNTLFNKSNKMIEVNDQETFFVDSKESNQVIVDGAKIVNDYFAELFTYGFTEIIEALITLAIGAFKENNYALATLYFSRAFEHDWQLLSDDQNKHVMENEDKLSYEAVELLLNRKKKRMECNLEAKPSTNKCDESKISETALTNNDIATHIHQLMYLTFAHHVIQTNPICEEMFRVSYEVRDLGASVDTRKVKTTEKRDGERVVQLASPCLEYNIVDQYYLELKNRLSLDTPSQEEEKFVLLWEPYRNEVEHIREEAFATRPGKRGKRHVPM